MPLGLVFQPHHFWSVSQQRNWVLIKQKPYYPFLNVDDDLKEPTVFLMNLVRTMKVESRFADPDVKSKASQWIDIQKYWVSILAARVLLWMLFLKNRERILDLGRKQSLEIVNINDGVTIYCCVKVAYKKCSVTS